MGGPTPRALAKGPPVCLNSIAAGWVNSTRQAAKRRSQPSPPNCTVTARDQPAVDHGSSEQWSTAGLAAR